MGNSSSTKVSQVAAHHLGLPVNKIKTQEIIMIGITSSIFFAILDLYAPTVNFQGI